MVSLPLMLHTIVMTSSSSIQILLEGVKDNHRIHLDYLKYLSTCQQQCCDASLQVNNLLNIFKR